MSCPPLAFPSPAADPPQLDLLVCGGGVVGLSICYEALQRGWQVGLIDAGDLGRAASWAGAGILPAGPNGGAVDPLEALRGLSSLLHRRWADALREETGIDTGYRICGGWHLGRTRVEAATLRGHQLWWREHGIDFESLPLRQLAEREPALAGLAAREPEMVCYWVPQEAQLRNPRHLRALQAACHRRGAWLAGHRPLQALDSARGRVTLALTSAGAVRAERYCLANGAWAGRTLESLGVRTGVLPVRGQMLLYRSPQRLIGSIVNDGHRYLVPRDDGHLLAGSCEEEVGFCAETTPEMVSQLRGWAEGLLPGLAAARLERTWAGLRPGSFDGFPYLGRVAGWENLYVASGHFRHGLHLSTATAEVLVQLMAGEPTTVDLTPFRVPR
jgi:glycine oxidase